MSPITAKDVMMPKVSLHLDDRGSTLVKKLSGKYHALPVVNNRHEVLGIVSEEHVLEALRNELTIFECTAESIMTCGHAQHNSCETPVAVAPETPVDDVIRTMFRERLSTVPVIKRKKLVGVIHRRDVITAGILFT